MEIKNLGSKSKPELEHMTACLASENEKLKEELRTAQSDNKDLRDLVIKLNMRFIMGY